MKKHHDYPYDLKNIMITITNKLRTELTDRFYITGIELIDRKIYPNIRSKFLEKYRLNCNTNKVNTILPDTGNPIWINSVNVFNRVL